MSNKMKVVKRIPAPKGSEGASKYIGTFVLEEGDPSVYFVPEESFREDGTDSPASSKKLASPGETGMFLHLFREEILTLIYGLSYDVLRFHQDPTFLAPTLTQRLRKCNESRDNVKKMRALMNALWKLDNGYITGAVKALRSGYRGMEFTLPANSNR